MVLCNEFTQIKIVLGNWYRKEFELRQEEKDVLMERGSPATTSRRIEIFKANGWTIVECKDYWLPTRRKYMDFQIVRLRKTTGSRRQATAMTYAIRKIE